MSSQEEMDDCRWFTRAQVAEAVQAMAAQARGGDPYAGGRVRTEDGLEFFVPPPLAIAHHLLKSWLVESRL